MRRRILCLLCALALAAALFPSALAAEDVCFTAINDNVLPLTADSMPTWSSGTLYVPYSVFDAGSTGISLGTSSIYNRYSGTVSVFSLRQVLIFDLNRGSCYNQHTGEALRGRAIIRNGKAYLPAAMVCSFFGLNPPSYLSTPYGYLVRITNPDQATLSDARFIDAASANAIQRRLREYNQSLQAQEDPEPSTQQPGTAVPDPEPTMIPTYLAFRCGTGQAGQAIAGTLEQNSAVGLFFFPAEEVGRQGALIRRLLAKGHSVGILAWGGSLDETRELLSLGSQALETVAHSRTYFALAPDSQHQGLEEDGWSCWKTGTDGVPDGSLSAYSHALTTVRALPKRDSARITLDDSAASAEALPYLLRQLRERQYAVTVPRETRF